MLVALDIEAIRVVTDQVTKVHTVVVAMATTILLLMDKVLVAVRA